MKRSSIDIHKKKDTFFNVTGFGGGKVKYGEIY
jgi:hypothetical protein